MPAAENRQEQGGKNVEQANEYVEKLKNEKRYKRDVLK
jgi:sulfite reductase alpha subunit-like flavoprotein